VALSDVLKTLKYENHIIAELDRYIISNNRQYRIEPPKIYPSSLSEEACPRAWVLEWLKTPNKVQIWAETPDGIRRPQNGSYVHLRYQDYFWGMGMLWGDWYCCGCQTVFSELSPGECPECHSGREALKYIELRSTWEHGISGKVDGILYEGGIKTPDPEKLDASKAILLEVKSINSRGFSRLQKPYDNHMCQIQVYMAGLGLTRGLFIYECKDDQKIKAFEVANDDKLLVKLSKMAEIAQSGWTNHELPTRICFDTEMAKTYKCPFQVSCFEREGFDQWLI
jgi:hypothetical protein